MDHENIIIQGLPIFEWTTLFMDCHNFTGLGIMQYTWPDGKSVLEQSNLLVEVFTLIKSEFTQAQKDENG